MKITEKRTPIIRSVVAVLLVLFTVALGLFFGGNNKVNAAATPFDHHLRINFIARDGSPATFSDVASMSKFWLVSTTSTSDAIPGVDYEFTYSNGENGSGTTDAEGKITFTAPSSGVSYVDLTIKSITDVMVCIPTLDTDYFENGDWNGIPLIGEYQFGNGLCSGYYMADDPTDDCAINFVIAQEPVTVEIDFANPSGEKVTLRDFNRLNNNMLTFSNPVLTTQPIIVAELSNGTKMRLYPTGYDIPLADLDGKLAGADKVTVKIYGYEGDIVFSDQSPNAFSGTILNGTVVKYDGDYSDSTVAATSGATIKATFIMPELFDGTFGFNCIDGSVEEGLTYNMTFQLMRVDYSSWNTPVEDFYWTYEGDDTKHYYDSVMANGDYLYHISIPVGKKIVMHNMPYNAMFHQSSTPNFYANSLAVIQSQVTDQFPLGMTTVTIDGQNFPSDLNNNTVYSEYMLYKVDGGDSTASRHFIDISGYWYNFGIGHNFDIEFYLTRNSAQFVFAKEYDSSDKNAEPDKEHHFKITLKDTETGKAFSEKVAYYVYDGTDAKSGEPKFATPNGNGEIDIYLKAGQYCRVGRNFESSMYSLTGYQYSYTSFKDLYVPGTGMLPAGIEYTIEEISDDYTYTVDKNTSATINSVFYTQALNKLTADATLQDCLDLCDKYSIDHPVITNVRKTGSLTVKKVVENDTSDKDFTFEIKLTDGSFTGERTFTTKDQDGKSGTLTFTYNAADKCLTATVTLKAGKSLTIDGIPSGVTFEVKETGVDSGDYKVTYTDNTGTITTTGSSATVTNTKITPTPTPTTNTQGRTNTSNPTVTPTPTATPTPTSTPSSGAATKTGEKVSATSIAGIVMLSASVLVISVILAKRTKRTR